ncbi:hypothetical protein E4U53_006655, partial [Claviceps sorghi]
LVTLGAASSQFGFFYKAGGELNWGDATTFAFSEEGRKVLLSEGGTPLSFACAILLISWIVKSPLCKLVGSAVASGEMHVRSALRWVATKTRSTISNKAENELSFLPTHEHDSDSDFSHDSDTDDANQQRLNRRTSDYRGTKTHRDRSMDCHLFTAVTFAALVVLGFLCIFAFFKPDRPYNRMCTTLPLPLLATFLPKPVECLSSSWPLPKLIEKSKWETPRGNYKGWAPGTINSITKGYTDRVPEWLPSELPSGFSRWGRNFTSDDVPVLPDNGCPDPLVLDPYYNPANDPLKITNLDNPFLEPLQQVLEEKSVKIRHIVLILMESMREEVFPLQQGSMLHDSIMKSHDEQERDKINELLSHVSPNAEQITGLKSNLMRQDGTSFGAGYSEWHDKTEEGFGGININGARTTSSISCKSLAVALCGTWPLPVDMFEESETEPYQPCLPQILELFNKLKEIPSGDSSRGSDDFHDHQWYPAHFQSVTDEYDRQNRFDDKIGIKYVVNKNRVKEDAGDNGEKEINYFGFPETVLKSYITDYVSNVTKNNQRMFMSHFTSTTHHPWGYPTWFNASQYLGPADGMLQDHKDFNNYLNTVRFTDAWIGQIMQILDDQGISNETLVVFVGDHGIAFKEDTSKTGTYGNSHVTNHRVPITFRHPMLPRVQHRPNATSLSIVPTILDLLVNTDSLNAKDTAVAADIVQDYEGQSLVRRYKPTYKGRRQWNFGVVNPGGRMLAVTSSDTPWRLVLALNKESEYTFADLDSDPGERDRIEEWSIRSLASTVRKKHGEEAVGWLREAEKVGLWWAAERKRLWKYKPSKKD